MIDLGPLRERIIYFPESDAFSLTFQSEGYNSIYVVALLESQFFYILFFGMVVMVDMILLVLSKKWPNLKSIREKRTKKFLYWNTLVRFFMEIYLSLTMFSLINLMNLEWKTSLPAVNFSNFFAIVSMIVVVVCPIVLIVFTMRHFRDLNNEEFKERHGAMTEGLELNYRERGDVQVSEANKL